MVNYSIIPPRDKWILPDGTPTREFYIFIFNLFQAAGGGNSPNNPNDVFTNDGLFLSQISEIRDQLPEFLTAPPHADNSGLLDDLAAQLCQLRQSLDDIQAQLDSLAAAPPRLYATMADQNADRVSITGGSLSGVSIEAQNLTFGGSVLNIYEVGSWTPAITVGGNSTTASSALGAYLRIGKLVMAEFDITLSSLNGHTGAVLITGLPIAVGSVVGGGACTGFIQNADASLDQLPSSSVQSGNTAIFLRKVTAGNGVQLQDTDISATFRIKGTASYLSS